MRRVAVTGVGAVTPLGLDVPSTWAAAQAGESGIDWISAFDTDGLPVRVAGEVKGFDPTQVVSPKEARKLERNVLLGVGAGREALADAKLNGFDPSRVGIIFGSAIGGVPGILEQADTLRERGPEPRLPELPAERARRLGVGPARDLARDHRPELRRRLGLRNRLARRRRGGRDDQARRGGRSARRRHGVLHHPADPGRLHRDARARGRRRVPAACVASVRRDAGRLCDVRGRRSPSCSRTGSTPSGAARRSTPRCSATARRTTHTTWRNPSPRRRESPR